MTVHQLREIEVDTIDELDHVHDEDECIPCNRDGCIHLCCDHGADYESGCEAHGCQCAKFLADGQCGECDGSGYSATVENLYTGREHDVQCGECAGTGTVPTNAGRWYR